VPAWRLTEIIWADLILLIYRLQPLGLLKRVDHMPEAHALLIGGAWPTPIQYTDLLSNDNRVLPLIRVTP
jgi:hypothetical protein